MTTGYPTTLKVLSVEAAKDALDEGAALVDLRDVNDYLDAHVRGSLALRFEFGPGMAGRARDCLPLDVSLILLEDAGSDATHAAAALRGKGFAVIGVVRGGLAAWGRHFGAPASTERVTHAPDGAIVLDVLDPGAEPPDGAQRVPLEALWPRAHEMAPGPVVVVAGVGVRAALAVGILERAGIRDVAVLETRR